MPLAAPPKIPAPPQQRERSTRSDLALLLVAALWGGSYLVAKDLTSFASVPTIICLRFLLAAMGLGIIFLVRVRKRPSIQELVVGLVLGCLLSCVLLLETYGAAHTTASNAGVIISLCLIFTPLLESAASRKWLPPAYFVAVIVAFTGVVLMVSGNGFRYPNIGDLLILAAALVRSVHVCTMSILTRGKPYNSVTLTLIQSLVCAVVGFAIDPQGPATAVASFGSAQWLAVAYLGLGAGLFAFLVQLWAVRRTSAARASLLMGTEPVWAALIAVLVAHEALGWTGVLGMVLIVLACQFGQRIERQARTGESLEAERHPSGARISNRIRRRR